MKNLFYRRLFFILIIIGLLVLLFQFVRLPFIPIRLHEAVPQSTAVILKFKNRNAVKDILQKQGDILLSKRIDADLDLFTEHLKLSSDQTFMTALRAPDLELLYITQKTIIPEKLEGATKSVFRKKEIFTVQTADNQSYSFSKFRNLTLIARESYLIEEGITQLKSYRTNLQKDKNFRRANRTNEEGMEVSVYLNFQNLKSQFSNYIGLKKSVAASNFGEWVNWLKLSLNLDQEGFNISGAMTGNLDFIDHLNELNEDSIFKILPDNTSVLTWMQAPLVGKFVPDFQKFFEPWISGEIAYVNIEPFSKNSNVEKFMVMKATDPDLAEQLLSEYSSTVGRLDSYDYLMFKVEQIMAEDVLMPVFGKRLNPIKNPYYVIIDDFVVFGNSKLATEAWLDKILAGKVLASTPDFLQSKQKLNGEERIYFNLNFSKLSKLLQAWLQPKYQKEFQDFFEAYEQFGHLSLKVQPYGKRNLVNGRVSQLLPEELKTSPMKVQTEQVWKAALSGEAITRPDLVYDPVSKRYYVFIQDDDYNLYCFSAAGEELWTRNIAAPLLSAIQLLPNLQGNPTLLFNTKEAIFKCQLNGTDIDNFPLKLKSPTQTAVIAIDFDDNFEYNLFVACRNKNIYGFMENGSPLDDWSPKRGVGRLKFDLKFLETQEKDLIIALNTKGELQVFGRNGEEQFESIKISKNNVFPPAIDTLFGSERIVVAEQSGRATVINSMGESFPLRLNHGEEKTITDFLFKDIINDSRKDYLSLSENTLSTFSYEENEFRKELTTKFPTSQTHLFDPNYGIGTRSETRGEIYLTLPNGQIHPDFPLGGTTNFIIEELSNSQQKELIVGCGNAVCVYRLGM